MTIVYLGLFWFFGLWLATAIELNGGIWLAGAAVSFVAAIALRRHEQARLSLACLCALCLAATRYVAAVPTIDESHVAFYNDGPEVILTGLVVAEPDVRDEYVNLRLHAENVVLSEGEIRSVEGLVLVRTPRFPVIGYGTRLQMRGQLETPPEVGDFSYRDYLARHGLHSLMNRPRLTVLAEEQGNPLLQAILSFKSQAQATINRLISDPQGALLSAILLGIRTDMSPGLIEDFRTTGLSHLTVVSGFHVSILVATLAAVATPILGRRHSFWFAAAGLLLYTILVGSGPSVIRAAIMGSAYLFATRLMGRPTFSVATLFTAGILMTAFNPFLLPEVGFQLSFAATLGIILYADRFSTWTRRQLSRLMEAPVASKVMGLALEVILISLAAQLFTLPLIIAHFGRMSLISLLANVFVVPAQPAVMTWGGLAILTGLIWPLMGQLLGWVAWLFLSYTAYVVSLLAAVPGADTSVYVSTHGVTAIYLVILVLTGLAWQRPERRALLWERLSQRRRQRVALSGSAIAAALLVAWGMTQPDGYLHVTFLNVGQGNAVLIQTPSGRHILVDGGRYPTFLNDQVGRQMPFWDRTIDVVIATQPDVDQVAGLNGVLTRYRVGRLVTNGTTMGPAAYRELLAAAGRYQVPVHHALAGEVIAVEDGVRLEILQPGGTAQPDSSVTLRLVYGNFSLLISSSDDERDMASMLTGGRPPQALVFKGSLSSYASAGSDLLLAAVQPQIAVIPAGFSSQADDLQTEIWQRLAGVGAAVLSLDELGTVKVITDGEQMWWQAQR